MSQSIGKYISHYKIVVNAGVGSYELFVLYVEKVALVWFLWENDDGIELLAR